MSNLSSRTLGAFNTPTTLPVAEFDLVNERLSKYASANVAAWSGFASAWNAIAYRLRAAHEHGADFVNSISTSSAPEPNERFRQDHNLFVFVVSAVSAVECFFFASHCFGSLISPTQFPMSKANHLKFYPKDVHLNFQKAFPQDPLTLTMETCLAASEFNELAILRNVLAHRGTPPRQHFAGNGTEDTPSAIPGNLSQLASNWQYNFTLDPQCLNPYVAFLDQMVAQLIIKSAVFARQKL